MTPRLQQAIKVLAMPRLELIQHLKQELEQNPILEEDLELETEIEEEELKQEELDPELNKPEKNLDRADNETDISWEDCFDDTVSASEKEAWEHHYDDDLYREDVAKQESLQDYLLEQLDLYPLSNEKYHIGEAIIGNIDDDGYLKVSVQEMAEDLGRDETEVEDMLKLIQYSFEPTGVGARDFRECLLIQIKELGLEDTLAAKIVDKHFEDFEKNNLLNIATALKVDIEDILEAKEDIKKLELYPGRQFAVSAPLRLKIPDVIIQKVDGEYRFISNDDGMPKLRLNKYYLDILNSNNMSPEEQNWIENSKRSAIDLIKSVEQRRRTILNVTESIFNVQKDFLEEGVKGLKPLLLRQVAEMANVHESTVSRVSRGKYVQTPQGIYELKDFFSTGVEDDSGRQTSTTVVKDMIKEMIETEDAANPYSDKDIVEILLKKKGIPMARRTVAKYRSDLNISPSPKRKKKW
jgi:RNA polymerase sigma-54 factor